MNKLKIFFAGAVAQERPIDLASALGVAGHAPQHGAPGPEYGKYEELNREAPALFESTSIESAQVVIHANRARDTEAVRQVSLDAQKRGLPCLFFSWGDADEPVNVPHGTVYRHSMFSDTRRACERAWPAFCSDPLLELGQEFTPRQKQERASVGFCGYVGTPLKRVAFSLLGRREKGRGLRLRARAMRGLAHGGRVQTKFVQRSDYWAGTFGMAHFGSDRHLDVRREFLDNLLGSDYTLCVRGAGNFSYRLYETLAAGRIPLFVNTRCVLPFEDEIDWRRHCVWVEEENLPHAGDVLADFHAGLSDAEFGRIQASNRQLWRERLCPVGFYRQILLAAPGISNFTSAAVVR